MAQSISETDKDVWIPTSCGMCYAQCGIKVHRVNGVVVGIEGNSESPIGMGRICSKGVAGIQLLYDPYRINYPLRRGNPEKGLGVDPKWYRISWDEAMDIIVEKFKETMEKGDPRGCFFQATTVQTSEIRFAVIAFMRAFGFKNYWVSGGGLHCGNGAHFVNGLTHASWSIVPDFRRCNLALYFGCSKGHGAGHAALQTAQQVADARARGMRMIVFDPFLSTQATKATEWVPIRVGTDAAMALSICNVLVNELGVYDVEYLKKKTNAAYLIRPDGYYVRDKKTNKPLIWDSVDNGVKVFDDPTIKDLALLGIYKFNGLECKPAFMLLKEHLKKYSPEMSSDITTISPATTRRIAKMLAEEARIGSTIIIDGKRLPYRPVAAIFFRGSQGHVNSGWNCIAIDLINHILGAADVPGGALGFGPPVCHGYPETGKPYTVPYSCPDGLMIVRGWVYDHKPYPLREPKAPTRMDLQDMFPTSVYNAFTILSPDWEKYMQTFKIPYRPEIFINFGSNSVMSGGNPNEVIENFLKKFKFVISFNLYGMEFSDAVADIVLPDTCFLERLTPTITFPSIFSHPQGLDEWCWQIRQPVVAPLYERRDFQEVMLELVKRLGIQDKYYQAINDIIPIRYGGELSEKYRLKPSEDYSWEDICDRVLKDRFGDDKGVKYFKKRGFLSWKNKPEEIYWRWFLDVRIPIYYEYFPAAGRKTRDVCAQFGMPDLLDWSFWKPLPDWHSCPSHRIKSSEYDLYALYWRSALHTGSLTMQMPWLDELSQEDPYTYTIQIHKDVAAKKGLKDGDLVWLENQKGYKTKGRIKTVDGIHPEHVCVAACAGHWTPYQPVAKGKGVFYDALLESDPEHTDPLTLGQDICTKVKVYKA
jgi:molybdopterin-containing oxidoreductase family molybdopterin binding subunit